MHDSTITIAGVEFVSPSACSFGDYGGAGSIGLANIRAIVADRRAGEVCNCYFGSLEYDESVIEAVNAGATVLHASGGYGSECVYIRSDSELASETLEALENYPSLDDDESSNIELQWEQEAWDSWVCSDLERKCWPAFGDDDDTPPGFDALSDSDKFEAYRAAMESENVYPTPEYSSVYIDVDRIADAYAINISRAIAGATFRASIDPNQMELPL